MRLVMPKDLNPANRLFGGTMLAWIDESAAMFVFTELKSKNVVTAKISEVTFNKPVLQGDILVFRNSIKTVGRTSVTVKTVVEIHRTNEDVVQACSCEMVFVNVDEHGNPTPHYYQE